MHFRLTFILTFLLSALQNEVRKHSLASINEGIAAAREVAEAAKSDSDRLFGLLDQN